MTHKKVTMRKDSTNQKQSVQYFTPEAYDDFISRNSQYIVISVEDVEIDDREPKNYAVVDIQARDAIINPPDRSLALLDNGSAFMYLEGSWRVYTGVGAFSIG